ncbi:MAG: hypothetical protein ACYSXF_10780 [Planctomycetota bacterium]
MIEINERIGTPSATAREITLETLLIARYLIVGVLALRGDRCRHGDARSTPRNVVAGLDPAIHGAIKQRCRSISPWMPGSSPGMTEMGVSGALRNQHPMNADGLSASAGRDPAWRVTRPGV